MHVLLSLKVTALAARRRSSLRLVKVAEYFDRWRPPAGSIDRDVMNGLLALQRGYTVKTNQQWIVKM
jgi:hypothetical protein